MSFAHPIAFTLAALALPIVALYILKVRLRRVPVSTNLFWQQIYREKPPRSIWQHFRNLISLLLQLLLLLLIVLAVADPYFSWQILQARRLVLLIDNSASMRATDVVPTRLDAAKAAASEIINGLRMRDEVAIVLAGNAPEVIVGLSSHAPTLRKAIAGISHSDSPTELSSAIALGRRLIDEDPHGQVIVFSDCAVDHRGLFLTTREGEAPAEPLPATISSSSSALNISEGRMPPVEYRLFATDGSNVGITQLQARRSLNDPLGYEILVSVRNASANAVACRLVLTLNDVPVDVIPLSLGPEERWSRSIPKTSLEGGRLHGELTHIRARDIDDSGPEAAPGDMVPRIESASARPALRRKDSNASSVDLLLTDNSAWALLSSRRKHRVLIVSRGNLFLQKVFEANPLAEVTTRRDFPETWPANSTIVLHGNVPAILPSGNVFVIDPIGNCDQWVQSGVMENPIVTEQDTASPLMNHIRLDNVLMPEARRLQFTTASHPLAKTLSGESIYSEVQRPNGKCLVLSANLDRSDLAFRTVFPIMVANSLGWFAGSAGEWQQSLPTGAVTTMAIPELSSEFREVNLLAPDGETSPIFAKVTAATSAISPGETAVSVATIGPLDQAGIWTLKSRRAAEGASADRSETVLAEVAVNLANERETDVRPFRESVNSSQMQFTTAGWFSRPLWYSLILVACLLTSVEWYLYQRRLIS